MEMVRFCPSCEDEFRPDILVCSDCGVDLILQPEGAGHPKVGVSETTETDWRTALDARPVATLVPIRTFDTLEDLEPAVAALAEIRLPSRVMVQNGRYILLADPESLSDAQAALHAASVDAEDAADGGFDPATGSYERCPACEAAFGPDFRGVCPECGLELTAPGGSIRVPEAE